MKERLLEFLKVENKSSAQLAEEIGVQASGISHILSGRNNPSLDFVLKMLEKYQFLSTDWFLFGKGSMFKDIKMQTLFDENDVISQKDNMILPDNNSLKSKIEYPQDNNSEQSANSTVPVKNKISEVEKIVWFYENNSFEEYFPKR